MEMQCNSERIVPYNDQEKKKVQIERMFDRIAGTYDQLNHTLSFGLDKGWRKKGIRSLQTCRPQTILDIATGTGDLAISLYKMLRPVHVTGVDISEGMMEVGRQKVEQAGYASHISFEQQDCTALSFEDNHFDAVTAAFGVRNFENIQQGLKEMHRVLKPGGQIMILELSKPERFPLKQLYNVYAKTLLPCIGRVLSRSKEAYHYLPASIDVVPQGRKMTRMLEQAGFKNARYQTFTFGVCSLYTGVKG